MGIEKVVILGGGFAGINAAKSLGNSKLDVWVILTSAISCIVHKSIS